MNKILNCFQASIVALIAWPPNSLNVFVNVLNSVFMFIFELRLTVCMQ